MFYEILDKERLEILPLLKTFKKDSYFNLQKISLNDLLKKSKKLNRKGKKIKEKQDINNSSNY